jgi:hypothetical protein
MRRRLPSVERSFQPIPSEGGWYDTSKASAPIILVQCGANAVAVANVWLATGTKFGLAAVSARENGTCLGTETARTERAVSAIVVSPTVGDNCVPVWSTVLMSVQMLVLLGRHALTPVIYVHPIPIGRQPDISRPAIHGRLPPNCRVYGLRNCRAGKGCGTDRGDHRQYEHTHFVLLCFRAMRPTMVAGLEVGRHRPRTE